MPKRTDINTILVIGSGPIVIGQACEFDYSGAQACKVLKEEGYRVVLVNSNPATIMTDPDLVDRTYVEPITSEFIEKIIEREKPDALLATLGGQTALNATVELAESGILDKNGVELIGCDLAAIQKGENRKLFNEAMAEIGVETARGDYAYSVDQALEIASSIGYPVILRPSFTLGGAGGGAATNPEELEASSRRDLSFPPSAKCSLKRASWAGKNTRWRSCAMAQATASSSARSKTSTPWACTPAIRSRSPQRRPSPISNTSACAWHRLPSSRQSAWRLAARTCSSPSTPKTAA